MIENSLPVTINGAGATEMQRPAVAAASRAPSGEPDAVSPSSQENFLQGVSSSEHPAGYDQSLAAALAAAATIFDESLVEATCAWTFPAGDQVASPCVGPDGTVYAGSDDHKLYAVKDGKKLWEIETGNRNRTQPCMGPDGTVCVGVGAQGGNNEGSRLLAVKEGKEAWSVGAEFPFLSSPCMGPDGTVCIGCSDRHLYAVKEGKVSWKYDTGGAIWSSPSLDNGIVYIGSTTGRVFGIKDGQKLWSFRTGKDLESSPVVNDGVVYVGGNDHQLYAIVPPETSMKRVTEAPRPPAEKGGESTVEDTEEWIIIDGLKLKKEE